MMTNDDDGEDESDDDGDGEDESDDEWWRSFKFSWEEVENLPQKTQQSLMLTIIQCRLWNGFFFLVYLHCPVWPMFQLSISFI